MPRYVDGFLLPLPRKNVAAYKRMARIGARVWMDHGALSFCENIADDVKTKEMVSFPKLIGCKAGEVAVFSYITYRSRAHRDRVNAKVMKDPRLARLMRVKMPFDFRRMAMGGFATLVSADRK